MKILIINTVPTDRNGITNVIFNYLSFMKRKIGRMDYVAINQPDEFYFRKIKEYGGNVYVLPRSAKAIFCYYYSLRRIITDNKYDAVHIHGNSHTVVLELFAAKEAGCPIRIVHAHSTSCKSVVLHKLLSPIFSQLCTDRLACGDAAGHFMFGKKSFTIMRNGIDANKFAFNKEKRDAIRKQLGWEQCIVLGHVGYFFELKNQSFIIDILNTLYENNHDYRLVLIGEGPLKEVVRQKAENLGLKDVVLMTGNIDNVDDYLNAIDIVVMPSLFEGVPLTLVEQQANGLRCFVSDTISKEADLTSSLQFLSLSTPAKSWSGIISSTNNTIDRKIKSMNAIKMITSAGYNIREEAVKLGDYYSSLKIKG